MWSLQAASGGVFPIITTMWRTESWTRAAARVTADLQLRRLRGDLEAFLMVCEMKAWPIKLLRIKSADRRNVWLYFWVMHEDIVFPKTSENPASCSVCHTCWFQGCLCTLNSTIETNLFDAREEQWEPRETQLETAGLWLWHWTKGNFTQSGGDCEKVQLGHFFDWINV